MKKKITAYIAAATLILGLVACGQEARDAGIDTAGAKEAGKDETEGISDELVAKSEEEVDGELTIKVGDQASYFVWKIGDAKGFFDEEFFEDNINVEVTLLGGGPAILEALTANELQFGIAAVDPLITSASGGAKLTSVLNVAKFVKNIAIYARNDAGIETVEDLKGHKAGVLFGTSRYNTLLLALNQAGLSLDDVEVLNLSNADTATALLTGEIDAAILGNTISQELSEQVHIISYADDVRDNYNIIVANTAFTESHPYTTARLLRAIQKTIGWVKENKEEAVQIVADITETDYDIIELTYDTTDFGPDFDVEELKLGYQDIIDILYEYDLIENTINADSIIDDQYARLAGIIE